MSISRGNRRSRSNSIEEKDANDSGAKNARSLQKATGIWNEEIRRGERTPRTIEINKKKGLARSCFTCTQDAGNRPSQSCLKKVQRRKLGGNRASIEKKIGIIFILLNTRSRVQLKH